MRFLTAFGRPLRARRLLLAGAGIAATIALLAPARGRGDTVRLRDGSSLRGRVAGMAADTLRFRLSFGAEVRIPRDRIAWIDFTDSLASAAPATAGTPVGATVSGATDSGTVSVSFKDRALSSKIIITKKQDWDGHVRANWIVQTLVVDGQRVDSVVDSVIDKTIYKGPDRILRNDIELVDLLARVPAGPHQCSVIVRNYGAEEYRDRFDGDPLDLEFNVDVDVMGGRETELYLGVDRGRFRNKKPRLYSAQAAR